MFSCRYVKLCITVLADSVNYSRRARSACLYYSYELQVNMLIQLSVMLIRKYGFDIPYN